MLWDTAGQEEFDAITKAYYRGNVGFSFIVVVYFAIQHRTTQCYLNNTIA